MRRNRSRQRRYKHNWNLISLLTRPTRRVQKYRRDYVTSSRAGLHEYVPLTKRTLQKALTISLKKQIPTKSKPRRGFEIKNIPQEYYICARRKIRKEVLFSQGVGGTKVKPPKYNQQSKTRCK